MDTISSIPPSKNVFLITSAQVISFLVKSGSDFPAISKILLTIFSSIAAEGYFCSKVTGNLSRNASLRTLVPMNFPSSLP